MTARLSNPVRRAVVDGGIVAGLLFAAYLFVIVAPAARTFGFDAYAYWSVDPRDPYAATAGALGAFTYSPVIALAFAPFAILPFWQFLWLWTGVLVGTAIWLGGRPVRPILAVFAFPPVALELYHGNVHLLMAAAIALGFRYPAAWSFVVLTKVTPGVGLAWFLFRREWRALAIALGVTAALAGISFLVNPAAWQSWITDSLGATAAGAPLNQLAIPIPLWIRVAIALVVVAWGARTDRRWTVPVAATLALPVLWPSGLAMLAAAVTLLQDRPQLAPGAPWWRQGPFGSRSAG
ncbi:MAG TPA: glycosyltransferase family 87 protein [Candidatus Nanopelagicales bacterium]|nr:glycosyltransferase family 87 protein [Candidatus Nanopelagicales bacterium]